MTKKKVLKIIGIILLVIVITLVLALAGAYAIYRVKIKPKTESLLTSVSETITDEELLREFSPYLENKDIEGLSGVLGEEVVENVLEEKKNAEEENAAAASPSASAAPAQSAEEKTPPAPKKKRSEYKSDYEYVKDNVPASDFAAGAAIVGKVDLGYISSLMAGGLTPEEKSELKSYLGSHLSSAEISRGIALYSKYSGLLK